MNDRSADEHTMTAHRTILHPAVSTVLITGGTRGLGKAIGLEFARAGASVFLTHRWGSADEDELSNEFRQEGCAAPIIVESDVADPEATRALMSMIKTQTGRLDAIISNVAFAKIIREIDDLKKASLDLSLAYSAWPLVDLVQATHQVFGQYPRYVVAMTSDGAQVCHQGYDLAGVSKAVLETLVRYLALRLKREGVRVNAIRPGFLDTASSRSTFGDRIVESLQARTEGLLLDPRGVARVALALCSGMMDMVTGQVIVVDEGWSLVSPVAYLTTEGLPGMFPANGDHNL